MAGVILRKEVSSYSLGNNYRNPIFEVCIINITLAELDDVNSKTATKKRF